MIDVLPSRLPFSLRCSGGSVMPFFQTVRAKKIYRFSVNFLRFAGFFETGVPLKKSPLSHASRFASSRLCVRSIRPRDLRMQVVHAKAQRREGENDMCLGVTLVRLSEQMFILGADGLGLTTQLWLSVSQKLSAPAPNGSARF